MTSGIKNKKQRDNEKVKTKFYNSRICLREVFPAHRTVTLRSCERATKGQEVVCFERSAATSSILWEFLTMQQGDKKLWTTVPVLAVVPAGTVNRHCRFVINEQTEVFRRKGSRRGGRSLEGERTSNSNKASGFYEYWNRRAGRHSYLSDLVKPHPQATRDFSAL